MKEYRNNELFSIGIDFGSLSARGVLADISDGRIIAEAMMEYPHGVMADTLPDGTKVYENACLQHPKDYLDALEYIVKDLMAGSGIKAEKVVSIGIDFTASTVLPIDKDFVPLCFNEKFSDNPHAWVKMWKDHSDFYQAGEIDRVCRKMGREYLSMYGGKVSPENLLVKTYAAFIQDREVFDASDRFMEAGDYIVSVLCGKPTLSSSCLAAKSFWKSDGGYPAPEFLEAIDPEFADEIKGKLPANMEGAGIYMPGEKAGTLSCDMAKKLGLKSGIAVSSFQMDAYAAMPGLGITKSGTLMMIIGTSSGFILVSDEKREVEGVTACIKDTMYKGLWTYASGQASVGDVFAWYSNNSVPEKYEKEAQKRGISVQQYLTELTSKLNAGESGLIALEWFNGNRSRLANSALSGMILGLTINTKPEHIYRALIEATAFGAKEIVNAFEETGVEIKEIFASGGVAEKNPLLMQIYADVLKKPIKVSVLTQIPALGSAILGAAAYDGCLNEAVSRMGSKEYIEYIPNERNCSIYNELFAKYHSLHEYFGRGENAVMEELRALAKLER